MPSAPPLHHRQGWKPGSFERERKSRQARGYDRDWERLRAAVLKDEPLCRMCVAEGRFVEATDVDHIRTIASAPHLRLERSNLQPLCFHHHRSVKQKEDRRAR